MVDQHRSTPAAGIADLPDAPKYNIKTVCVETGIRPVTLRAWERRYRLLRPHRTHSNYRLYSERDLAVLRWLKNRVDSGLPISSVALELAELRRAGRWPEAVPLLPKVTAPLAANAAALAEYAHRLYLALTAHDEPAAAALLSQAHAAYDIQPILLEMMTPCLVAIGEAWQRGQIRITTEHFASNFLRGRLLALFQAQPVPRQAPRLLVGCAPHELHDIGSLMLALLLRREGYRVEFLGQDVNVEDLLEYARLEHPAMICLSAGSEQSARELSRVHAGLTNLRPRPKFGYGGRAFSLRPTLRDSIPGLFLGDTLDQACDRIRQALSA